MGIPGVFISLLYEIAMLPGFKESGLPMIVDNLYEKHKIDLRHEIPVYKELGRQSLPIAFNEIYVRLSFFLAHLAEEISIHNGIKGVNWSRVIPFNNRTVDRMITVSAMTFTIADTIDASVHAAIESGGNWVLFSGKFVTRFNYAGAGRAAVAIVKEVISERREAQLLKEKLILTEAKTMLVIEQLEEYKKTLELKLSNYLAEDISEFMEGFDYIESGLSANDSDVVIKGNLVIQKVLGREPQFTNQEEFDELMESDTALVL